MKKTKRFLLLILSVTCLSFSGTCLAQGVSYPPLFETPADNPIVGSSSEITPYADVIVWRYKVINGYLYKRQYNTSKQKWIGSWIPC